MNFHILESYPNINHKYLDYLKKNWHKIFLPFDDISKNNIDWIIVRSKIKVDKKLIDSYINLKYVFRVWVWVENIDINYLTKKNIILKNTPWVNSQAVAELVLWWILSLLRKTYKKWDNLDDRFLFIWDELSNKTIWIVWFWAIWKKIYNLINTFWENNFLIYDPFLNPSDFKESNIIFVKDKKELFKKSDIISFHIPLLENTKDFLSWDDFMLLKNNIKIVNTSRWWIINEYDLIKFLKQNEESSAFIDTWEWEPWNYKKEFNDLKNIIITPHIWAMTKESIKKMHEFEIYF